MNTTAHQAITKDIVKDVAEDLMEKNGQTTTLEVKDELRNRGYWAVQDEVSNMMFDLGHEEDWDIQNDPTGTHRVYSNDESDDDTSIFTVNTSKNKSSGSSKSVSATSKRGRRKLQAPHGVAQGDRAYTRRDGQQVQLHDDPFSLSKPYWKVTSTRSNVTLYADGQYPRDMVRGAYRGICGTHIHTVRSQRVK